MANQQGNRKALSPLPLSASARPHHNSSRTAQVFARAGNLTLAEWLQVSWFYPEGFKKQFIKETANAHLVFGEHQILKFVKSPNASVDDFKAKWFSACDEYADHLLLCQNLYLGLLLLRFVDGEPTWEVRNSWQSINRHITPNADEVVLVLHRVAERQLFASHLLRTSSKLQLKISTIASTLTKFHQQQKLDFAQQEESIDSAVLLSRWETQIRNFSLDFSNYLDPYTQIALEQASSFVASFVRNKQELFQRRLREGFYLDGHGALSSQHIYCKKLPHGSVGAADDFAVVLFARAAQFSTGRLSDQLNDVASLVVDFKSRGFHKAATQFEEAYFIRNGNSFHPEIYRFLLIVQSLLQARLLMAQDSEQSFVVATNCISMAFRLSLGIEDNIVLVVVGKSTLAETVAGALAALTGVKIIESETISESSLKFSSELHFEPLLARCVSEQAEAGGVVFRCPELSSDQELQLNRSVIAKSKRYALLRCDAPQGEARSENIWQATRDRFSERLCSYPVSNLLSPPDLAFLILRQLAQGGVKS